MKKKKLRRLLSEARKAEYAASKDASYAREELNALIHKLRRYDRDPALANRYRDLFKGYLEEN